MDLYKCLITMFSFRPRKQYRGCFTTPGPPRIGPKFSWLKSMGGTIRSPLETHPRVEPILQVLRGLGSATVLASGPLRRPSDYRNLWSLDNPEGWQRRESLCPLDFSENIYIYICRKVQNALELFLGFSCWFFLSVSWAISHEWNLHPCKFFWFS